MFDLSPWPEMLHVPSQACAVAVVFCDSHTQGTLTSTAFKKTEHLLDDIHVCTRSQIFIIMTTKHVHVLHRLHPDAYVRAERMQRSLIE